MAISTVTLKGIQKVILDFEARTGKDASSITLNNLTLVNLELTIGHMMIWGIHINEEKDRLEMFGLPVLTPKGFGRNKILIN